jgi:DNA-binding SARP family transcriptional activator
MLLQSWSDPALDEPGPIRVFPALPSDWQDEATEFHDLRAEGAFADAAAAAQAAVKGDPLRESPRAALIRVHLAEGNVSEALREFAQYRTLLLRELDLEPTPRLQALLDQVT